MTKQNQEIKMATNNSNNQRGVMVQPGQQPRRSGSIGGKINHTLRRRASKQPGLKPDRSEVNPCVKYFLFFMNFILLILGAAMLAIGIFILTQKEKSVTHIIDFLFDPVIMILVLGGSIITFIAFFGAYGSLRENTGCLQTYSITMAIMLLIEVILIIFVFIFYFMPDTFADMGLYPEDSLDEAIIKYREDPDMQGTMDRIQELLSCCGKSNDEEGYKDWNSNLYFQCDQKDSSKNKGPESCSVPYTCCRVSDGDAINYQCGAGMLRDDAVDREKKIFTQGCLKGLEVVIKDNIWIYGGIIMGILIPQAAFICCAKAMVFQVKEQKMKW